MRRDTFSRIVCLGSVVHNGILYIMNLDDVNTNKVFCPHLRKARCRGTNVYAKILDVRNYMRHCFFYRPTGAGHTSLNHSSNICVSSDVYCPIYDVADPICMEKFTLGEDTFTKLKLSMLLQHSAEERVQCESKWSMIYRGMRIFP